MNLVEHNGVVVNLDNVTNFNKANKTSIYFYFSGSDDCERFDFECVKDKDEFYDKLLKLGK